MLRFTLVILGLCAIVLPVSALEPIPDKLIVLTFDDSSKSHFTVARPILKKYRFGATFFITEGFDFLSNKRDYMSWEEIAQLHKDGFEIGNHTRDHLAVSGKTLKELSAQVRGINERCKKHGIPTPVSFAYPGNGIHPGAFAILKDLGIRFARRGGSPEYPYKEGRGFAYEPGFDHPLLIPSAGDARPNWTLADFKRAVEQARHGRIAVLQFHGVPDTAHDWVSSSKKQFEEYMKHLAEEGYSVIAMRDLAKYVDPTVTPSNHNGIIEDRQRLLKLGKVEDNARRTRNEEDLRDWLENMATHRFHPAEMATALGRSTSEVQADLKRLRMDLARPVKYPADRILVLPYPGGRHPRIGFLDGAIRPQRETKVSVFAPWANGGYAVADVPEAIWWNQAGKRELLYLAHTHVPTTWDRRGVVLDRLEWSRKADGSLECERRLPNKVTFAGKVRPGKHGVRMELALTNGTDRTLTGLQVQMCVMLRGLVGFEERSNDNKVFSSPFSACRDRKGRWIITGWEPCVRVWGNPPCPCLHADPQIPDCAPGKTERVRGWLSFYEGKEIEGELARLGKVAFIEDAK
jgi:peptidoglycan/xylan/chitin deacetylase (PgdA/CDA1 family)